MTDTEFEEEMARVCEEIEASSLKKDAKEDNNGDENRKGEGKEKEEKKEECTEPDLFLGKRGGGQY